MQNLLIIWNQFNLTGVHILDEQHRGLVSITNSLHYARGGPRSADFLAPIADMMLQYTRIHFTTEIDILKEAGYPDVEAHEALHEQLIADIQRYFHESQVTGDSLAFLNFLKGWWINHINHEDAQYAEHMRCYLASGGAAGGA
jgi:hemerythrin-like metal-binding protein